MIPEGELRLISLWTTPTTLDRPYYTVLLYCMMKTSTLYHSKFLLLQEVQQEINEMISEAATSQSDEDDDLSDDAVEGEALMLSWL